jgi:holo-[acyl-carrier protein] synthase
VTGAPMVGESLSVGVDMVELERLRRVLEHHGERFLERIYTPEEAARFGRYLPELAARFAAKEAVSKALGVGMRLLSRNGIGWHDVAVLPNERGKPELYLSGRAWELAEEQGLVRWAISLTHGRDYALAFVVAQGDQ